MPTQSFIKINKEGYPTIDLGKMRHSITIQYQTPASPPAFDAGGPVLQWSQFLPNPNASPPDVIMAAIGPVSGKDVIKSGQTVTQLFVTVAMWYQPGILPNMRVVSDNGAVYIIQSIENALELNVAITLNCIAIGANDI